MIKNILFDVGNVLLDFDPERFLKEAGYTCLLYTSPSPRD